MRKNVVVALALGCCLGVATAFAQDNAAVPSASNGPASGDDVIYLHMPVHHIATHARASRKPAEEAAPAEAPSVDSIGADTALSPAVPAPAEIDAQTASPPQTAPSVKAAKSPRPSSTKSAPAIPFSFGEDAGTASPQAPAPASGLSPQAAASTRETKTASLPPKPQIPKHAPVPSKPVREATRAMDDAHAGLTKRGAVMFDKGKSNPSPQQFDGLKLLAGDLSTALESGAGRVQLEAYGGAPGDKSSDAHRLSLKRALAVRQLLIDDGIPSNRIDVRALGGADDKGPNDRVDVYVRAS